MYSAGRRSNLAIFSATLPLIRVKSFYSRGSSRVIETAYMGTLFI
jgi:hypothetical protein